MIAVTGTGHVVLGEGDRCDPTPHLRERKTRKYLGRQDDLSVLAAAAALRGHAPPRQPIETSGVSDTLVRTLDLGDRTGLYLAVGYIPFELSDIRPVLESSLDERGQFSMERFAGGGYQRAHPLLTFRCLPNMPAYHVSACFDIQGPYLVSYPGPSQVYAALEEACRALEDGAIDRALVGGVAAQRNFLVEHHFARIDAPIAKERLRDAAGFLLLEREESAASRGAPVLCRVERWSVEYEPFDPRDALPVASESFEIEGGTPPFDDDAVLGAASLPVAISRAFGGDGAAVALRHRLAGHDGTRAESVWRRG